MEASADKVRKYLAWLSPVKFHLSEVIVRFIPRRREKSTSRNYSLLTHEDISAKYESKYGDVFFREIISYEITG
jgi:hypothetical protein